MFALRNVGSPLAVDALAAGLSDDRALFKHEIAFVFGQLLSPHSRSSKIRRNQTWCGTRQPKPSGASRLWFCISKSIWRGRTHRSWLGRVARWFWTCMSTKIQTSSSTPIGLDNVR